MADILLSICIALLFLIGAYFISMVIEQFEEHKTFLYRLESQRNEHDYRLRKLEERCRKLEEMLNGESDWK